MNDGGGAAGAGAAGWSQLDSGFAGARRSCARARPASRPPAAASIDTRRIQNAGRGAG